LSKITDIILNSYLCDIKIVSRFFEDVAKLKNFGNNINGSKLHASRGMLATFQFRVFYFPTCCLRTYGLNQKSKILPVLFYGYEPWSLILRKEHRLKVFENRVLRRKF
jgi:hypothetical protein